MGIFKFFKYVKDFISNYTGAHKFIIHTPYMLEEINTETEQVTIHCRGSRAYIKTSIGSVIFVPNIINGLPSMHACWIGYYYGCFPHANTEKRMLHPAQGVRIKKDIKKRRFEVISLETRTSILTYYDKKTNQTHKEKITDVVQDQFVINNINPTQACYIGIQAGFAVYKHGHQALNRTNFKPVLKLVS